MFRSYGSTEHPSITGARSTTRRPKRLTTDGRALPGVEMRLDEDGEILEPRPRPASSATPTPSSPRSVFDDDGWYRTGDVGVLDDDGYLTITDRVSDIIIRGGENISAQEIEELLIGLRRRGRGRASSPSPTSASASAPPPSCGCATGTTAPTLDDVRAHLAEAGLAKQKWPESIHAVADFPRTPSGKVQKFKLRQQLREGALEQAVRRLTSTAPGAGRETWRGSPHVDLVRAIPACTSASAST